MPKAKKLPSGRWRARSLDYIDSNKKYHYRSFTADTKKQAEFMAIEFEMKHKNRNKPSHKTVGSCIDDYIDNRRNALSPSTIAEYCAMRKRCLPVLMDTAICNLNDELLQRHLDEYSAGHSPKSTFNLWTLISSSITRYDKNLSFSVTLPEKRKAQPRIPSEEEFQTIVSAIKGTELELPVLLAACGGLRRSEICALDYPDLDFVLHTVNINKALVLDVNRNYVIKQPKTQAGYRTVSLPQFVFDIAKERQRQGAKLINILPNDLTRQFLALLKTCNIPPFRFHDLRHYTASIMKLLNIPDTYAAAMLGHSTPEMTRRVYQHIINKEKQQQQNALQNYFATKLPHSNK